MSLYDRQVELEQEMQGLGAKRFWDAVTKSREGEQESHTIYGQQLAQQSVLPLAAAIETYLEAQKTSKGGPKPTALRYLALIEAKVAAFIAVKTVLDCITLRRTLQKTAVAIASGIEDEVRFRAFESNNPRLWATLTKDLHKRTRSDAQKRTVLVHSMNKAGERHADLEWEEWGQIDKYQLGARLVDLLALSTSLIRVVTIEKSKRQSATVIEATPETLAWIEEKTNRCQLLAPVYLPTIIPPKPWTNPYSGGYHTKAIRAIRLVKTRNQNYLEELTHQVDTMPTVYQAINAVQATPWAINRQVLEVMRTMWDEALDIGAIPQRADIPLPPKPHDIATNKEARTEWKHKASKVHEANVKVASKRIQVVKILYMAEKFAQEEAIYFPHQLDFRGRMYAVPSFLNPQGCDMAKGMLQFAEGKPVGNAGSRWLMIHAANCFGEDKCSLDDRVEWSKTNLKRIVLCASAPLEETWWVQADKPWQFLAACFEIQAVLYNPDYRSHLPVSVDGSCNGLQNFSAMLRDPIGGAAVNLLPSELPNDIYAQVAAVAKAKVQADAMEEVPGDTLEMAQGWMAFGFDRKATKRPVMTLPYGATQYSARQYVKDYIDERKQAGDALPWEEDHSFKAANYLAKHIWNSIGEVVVAARAAMDWLQRTATITAMDGLPVNWRTPVGFPVLQSYYDTRERLVKTQLGGQVHCRHILAEETDQLDRRRQASGISPNFVHSMDACALMLSVRRAVASGVTNFGMVHDSYGTLAADMDILARCLREAFVELYQHDVLEEFRTCILAGLSEKRQEHIPPCPPKGSLDLSAVKDSLYFFA